MQLNNARIFVVEDDPFNIGIITMLLERMGAVVKVDSWGADAKQQLLDFAPVDLVLLDLMISDKIDGYDIYNEIYHLDTLEEVPIAIVSASDPDIEMTRAREQGFNGFIGKPIDFNQFPKRIIKLLDGEAVWHEN